MAEDNDALLKRVRDTLGLDASEAAQTKLAEALERVAARLALEWLSGDRRFESVSQQTEHWLAAFYEEIFTDEQPDATRIYERFGVSLPRATYLARLLRARRTGLWRAAARQEVQVQLERHEAAALEDERGNVAHVQEYELSLSSGAADELRVIYNRLSGSVAEKERPSPPKPRPSYGDARWFAIRADSLLLILRHLKGEPG